MTVAQAIDKVCKLAEEQVGYKASADKHTKYTEYLDSLGDYYNYPKQWKGGGADWCDIMIDCLFAWAFTPEVGRQMLYQPKKSTGAGCGFSAGFYRQNNAWSKTPQRGSQIFYGSVGNESHTGIVVKVEDTHIWTVEGNTGGGTGQVQKKKVPRSANIAGYGIPNWKLATKENDMKQWGIDISGWQGNFNMTQAKKEGVKFVVLKGGGGDDGLYKDNRFEENYKKAKDLKLPVGVYWFSRATTTAQAKKEAEFFYNNCLKGKQFELPIYIDVEHKAMLNLGKRKLTDIILTWLQAVRNMGGGYWVGIYSSASYFKSYMYDNELVNYAHWVAQWSRTEPNYSHNVMGLWQFGGETNYIRTNKVAGQVVDQNYLFYDYESAIKNKGLNGWGKTTTPQTKPTTTKPEQKTFKVKVTIPDLYIRAGAGTNTAKRGFCPKGTYTITETKKNGGHEWGKLSNGKGWIALEYTTRL